MREICELSGLHLASFIIQGMRLRASRLGVSQPPRFLLFHPILCLLFSSSLLGVRGWGQCPTAGVTSSLDSYTIDNKITKAGMTGHDWGLGIARRITA